jgi:predicted PurR-regulated permease PerM
MLIGFFGGILALGMAGFVIGPVFIVLLFHGYQRLLEEKKGSENPVEN